LQGGPARALPAGARASVANAPDESSSRPIADVRGTPAMR